MKKRKIGLLARIAIAILLGIPSGLFFPPWAARVFLTFNGLFSQFLDFIVPLIILALIAPGIAELGYALGQDARGHRSSRRLWRQCSGCCRWNCS